MVKPTDAPPMTDAAYEARALAEALAWRDRQLKRPGLWDKTTRATQDHINRVIPERVHEIVTGAVQQMTRGLLAGSEWTTARPLTEGALQEREALAALEAAMRAPHDPDALKAFDWRKFQLEYRDYIDVAKLAQLLPLVGAPIGAVVNWRLTQRLAETAMNAYRLRLLADQDAE